MKTILAYRFSAFGDVAMTVPVFREFLEQNKDVRIVMVSRKGFSGLFEGIERIEFVGINIDDYKGILGMRKLAKELLKKYNPDFIADLHDVIRSKILYLFFKRRGFKVYKINKGKEDKEELTDVWNLNKHQLKKTTERYADVLRSMGYSVNLSHTLRPLVKDKSGIGFAPFAQHRGKMMPLEKSFELVRELAKSEHIYFFGGGASEVEVLSKWEKEIPNTTCLAGKLSLSDELNMISKLRVMISMDSANMHLASLVGTRVVSVWGATHPYAGFLGYGQKEEDVVGVKDLTCRPCSVFGDKECYRGDWACLEELKIQQVIDKVKK
ncbi:glycosyl transferase [Elizabethkingia anophelis]|uniref:glycosyltransferase family 9 protein n=1 Tax=Elizabethkingia anophelis TaxID=1117645 RepID=UPI0021A4EEAC|nr:glycosyltransferase family 9 protein [Elizabethkingia anophelis]MCT3874636.1 glycosyltransferase family 9 protein [Elizabethkingia anophelis]MDV3538280.1 glycosyl transferase [Elizabethkingia anophelis]MDV3849314.1 glycosyl transferase [Elizabethkingia anophelis]